MGSRYGQTTCPLCRAPFFRSRAGHDYIGGVCSMGCARRVCRTIMREELEPDEFLTAEQKAITLLKEGVCT